MFSLLSGNDFCCSACTLGIKISTEQKRVEIKNAQFTNRFIPRFPNSSLVVDRKRAAAILASQALLSFLAILTTDAFSFAASQLTVI